MKDTYRVLGRMEQEAGITTFSDIEGVLAFFGAADEVNLEIEEHYIDSYIYLLKEKGIPFSYTFVHQPVPYSKALREDLWGLRIAGYITDRSIGITNKGKEWVKGRQMIISDFRELLTKIIEYATEFRSYYGKKALLDAIYARVV